MTDKEKLVDDESVLERVSGGDDDLRKVDGWKNDIPGWDGQWFHFDDEEKPGPSAEGD